jgi:hypothetical protein
MSIENEDVSLPEPKNPKKKPQLPAVRKKFLAMPHETRVEAILEALVTNPNQPHGSVLSAIGAGYDDYVAICMNKEFQKQLKERTKAQIALIKLPSVISKVSEKASEGDDKAVSMYMKYTGVVDDSINVNTLITSPRERDVILSELAGLLEQDEQRKRDAIVEPIDVEHEEEEE